MEAGGAGGEGKMTTILVLAGTGNKGDARESHVHIGLGESQLEKEMSRKGRMSNGSCGCESRREIKNKGHYIF